MINKIHYDLVIKKDDFFDAKPFPYLVLDNFFTPKFFERLNKSLNKVKNTSDIKIFSSSVENEKTIFLNQKKSLIEDIAKLCQMKSG